jgi:4-hydroxybenzoate polyprenyltransferase
VGTFGEEVNTEFLRLLFWSSRPVSWVNTAFPFAAAYLLTAQQVDAILVIGTLFFLVPYNLLMYGVNDVFDYESDLNNPRKGGIEGAVLAPYWHRPIIIASIVSTFPFVLALIWLGTWQATLVLFYILFMVVAYSAKYLRFKEKPLLDSITSSTHFVGPMVYALVLAGWSAGYWPYVVAFFLWGMASHAFGAVQDVLPDREAKISSIATAWGARAVVWFASVLYFVAGLLLIAQPWPVPFVGICSWLYLTSTLPYIRITDETSARANNGWRRFMALNMLSGFVITIILIFELR